MKIGLHQVWKLAYTFFWGMKIGLQNLEVGHTKFSVGQLQFWGFEVGLQKLEVGLHYFFCRPTSSLGVENWPTKIWSWPTPFYVKANFNFGGWKLAYKNLKLAYNNFSVGKLQVWGMEIGLQIIEVDLQKFSDMINQFRPTQA